MFKYHLQRLLDKRDINRHKFSIMTGIRYDTIVAYCEGIVKRLDIDHLKIMCKIFNCQISDIIEYVPNKK